ncbi:GTPase [Leptodesmis sp.]|uniref:GTPase n=1 Tax=Leptodesmis sp. TaxID=3100501 RepID=UPI00405350B1
MAPEHTGEQIKRLQREILLSGPEYDGAIRQCAKIAREDIEYANKALRDASLSLQKLGNDLQPIMHDIQKKIVGKGEYQTAKDVAKQLEQTRRNLSAEILHNLESVRETLQAKQRSLNHFSIAFMGRTKAGKSTLHAVITGEGWESIGIGKQRTTRYNRVYEWKGIRIIDTPGIGAPGGKTDEEIARSVIEEADVICYVVTNDSIQESEFAFLKVLKEKTKPLIILLNIRTIFETHGG